MHLYLDSRVRDYYYLIQGSTPHGSTYGEFWEEKPESNCQTLAVARCPDASGPEGPKP